MPKLKLSERTQSVIESFQLVKIAVIPVEKIIEFVAQFLKNESLHGVEL
jgi:hypothetical protein